MEPIQPLKGLTPVELIDEATEAVMVIIQELEATNIRMHPPKQQRFDEWALGLRASLRFGKEIQDRIKFEIGRRARYNDTKQTNRRAAAWSDEDRKEVEQGAS